MGLGEAVAVLLKACRAEEHGPYGQLQGAGVLAYASGIEPTHDQAVRSVRWILQNFGVKDDSGQIRADKAGVESALQSALNFHNEALDLPQTEIDWTRS